MPRNIYSIAFLSVLTVQLLCIETFSVTAFNLPSTNSEAKSTHSSFSRGLGSIKTLFPKHKPVRGLRFPTQYGHRLPKTICNLSQNDSINDKPSNDQRTYDNMGFLSPLAEALDGVSGEWALSYADLSPATPKTPAGIAFLATNIGYAAAGIALGLMGDYLLGTLTEVAGIVSFWYHYVQLDLGQNRSEVRLALLTDYITASTALLAGLYYIADMGLLSLPLETVGVGGLGILCLALCWVWEFGYPYLILHSLWHIFSAYTAYSIGQAHMMGTV